MHVSISQAKPFRIRRSIVDTTFRAIEKTFPQYRQSAVSVAFVTNQRSAALNKQYRNIAGATDVLSFAEGDASTFTFDQSYLGDIIIAYPYARKQARQQGIRITDELIQLLAHGFLHLVGYNHQDDHSFEEMLQHEQKIITLSKQLLAS